MRECIVASNGLLNKPALFLPTTPVGCKAPWQDLFLSATLISSADSGTPSSGLRGARRCGGYPGATWLPVVCVSVRTRVPCARANPIERCVALQEMTVTPSFRVITLGGRGDTSAKPRPHHVSHP